MRARKEKNSQDGTSNHGAVRRDLGFIHLGDVDATHLASDLDLNA
jgi:hypothetical protein